MQNVPNRAVNNNMII